MPLVEFPSAKTNVEDLFGGIDAIGYRLFDMEEDLARLAEKGLSRVMVERARCAMELEKQHLAQVLGIPLLEWRVRYRPPPPGRVEGPLVKPGDEATTFLRLCVIHAFRAKYFRLAGRSAEGISRNILLQVIPDLGHRGLDLVKSREGAQRLHRWMFQRPGYYPWPESDTLVVPGHEVWRGNYVRYPRRPMPWQSKKKKRLEAREGRRRKEVSSR